MLYRTYKTLISNFKNHVAAAKALLAMCALAVGGTAVADENRILVIGAISNADYDVSQSLQPMAEYVKSKMADLGIEDVVVVSAPDREHLAQLIRHGRVDWFPKPLTTRPTSFKKPTSVC